jgi:purine-nucleoside phosphorylase
MADHVPHSSASPEVSSPPASPSAPSVVPGPAGWPARLDALEAVVRARTDLSPRVGIVLVSGLGELAGEIHDSVDIPFRELPGWPAATAPGHAGRLVLGRLEGVPIVALQGRFHLYEGHLVSLVVEPVLLMGRLGAAFVLLTNAAGGVDPSLPAGTLMLIRDHLNLTGVNPLIGANADTMGPRFPDLTQAWSATLRKQLRRAADDLGLEVAEGVYVQLLGPSYETPAEVRMLRGLGASAVGMSTVVEAIAARWAGIEVAGISLVTNAGAGATEQPLTHEEVLEAAAAAGPRLRSLVRRFVALAAGESPAT